MVFKCSPITNFREGKPFVEEDIKHGLDGVAMVAAITKAFKTAVREVKDAYKEDCPAKCPNKAGVVGYNVLLELRKLPNRSFARCTVFWILSVSCLPEALSLKQPVVGDYKELLQQSVGSKGRR